MAEARQCDRCGTLFAPDNTDREVLNREHPFFVQVTNIRFGECITIDLCTDCTADLIAWFIGRNHGRAKLQEYGIVDKF